jgi:hypothetical protein
MTNVTFAFQKARTEGTILSIFSRWGLESYGEEVHSGQGQDEIEDIQSHQQILLKD